jgi:hypothetical protein
MKTYRKILLTVAIAAISSMGFAQNKDDAKSLIKQVQRISN